MHCSLLCDGHTHRSKYGVCMGDLVKYGHMQAAHELDDTFHKEYCKRDRKVFDFTKEVLLKEMERK